MKFRWSQIPMAVLIFFVALSGIAAHAQAQQTAMPPATTDRPLKERIGSFESADRDEWQKPDQVIQALHVKSGQAVADIGAGSGYFSRRFAKAVGPQGRVLAVDIDQEILGYLKGEAQKLGLNQVEIIVSKEDDPMLSPDSIDLAFSCDTSHHIRNRVPFYAKVNRALKPGGRLAVLDIPPDAHTKGLCRHKVEELVPRDQAIEEAKAAGFVLVEEYNFVLPRQYFLVFQKK